jgi:hypothetical protein
LVAKGRQPALEMNGLRTVVCSVVLTWLMSSPALAQALTVVESMTGTNVTSCPSYCELTGNWGFSSLKSSAPGTSQRNGARFTTSPGAAFTLYPLLTCPNPLSIYRVSVSHGISESISSNLMVAISVQGGSNLPPTTDAFQRYHATNEWYAIGYLYLDGSTNRPAITFTQVGGEPGRFYADAFQFDSPCPCPYLPSVGITGPLLAGQSCVKVSEIVAGAERITVMAICPDNSLLPIGEKSSGLVAGTNCVPALPLTVGWKLYAQQWKFGCMSPIPVPGMLVTASLNATRTGEALVLQWEGVGALQMSTNPFGPFVTLPGATSPYTNDFLAPQQFFRTVY